MDAASNTTTPAMQPQPHQPQDEPLVIAYYATGHGLGHATRAVEVCKRLVARGHSVTVVTGAPARVFLREVPSAHFTLRRAVLDCGALQRDPFTVDVAGSLEEYRRTAVAHRTELLDAEVFVCRECVCFGWWWAGSCFGKNRKSRCVHPTKQLRNTQCQQNTP
jgi:hypothetical protein